jgi:cytidylate kinase
MQNSFRTGNEKSPAQKKSTETRVLPETSLVKGPLPTGIPPVGSVVITVSRQFGSGGSDIAHLVSQSVGLSYIDQQIIAQVASRLGVDLSYATRQDEQTSSIATNILEALRSSNPFNVHYMHSGTKAQEQSQELAYFHLTQRVILELATQGNAIIIGRGSQFLLHNNPRTLHTHIFAPLKINAAKELIEQRDNEQDNYQRHYYGADGHQTNLYHLLINTGLFSFESAASLIQQALPTIQEIG